MTVAEQIAECVQEAEKCAAKRDLAKLAFSIKFGRNWRRFINAEEKAELEDIEETIAYFKDLLKELKRQLKNV